MPKLGESILHATVVQWFKKVGDWVNLDEPLLEVSTDKVNSEIPSPYSGRIESIQVQLGEEAEVGQLLAILTSKQEPVEEETSISQPLQVEIKETDQRDLFSPSVLRLLKEKGLGLDTIDQIPRSGCGGRLTKKDVESFSLPKLHEDTERVKMSALRKAIADNMVRSFYEAPHASLATEVDVTHIVKR
ncbi:MAG: E3 binding domain-containing protein, partial [Chlamydiia bacterium]|nr:E3 binding domain-containing protein [Chlamydiia bacterium]